jgi:hypothetical protein
MNFTKSQAEYNSLANYYNASMINTFIPKGHYNLMMIQL